MAEPLFIELGMGADLRGMDATKAAARAVRNAIGHNLLPGLAPILREGGEVAVHVRLAVPAGLAPVETDAVLKQLPIGTVTVEIVEGGMRTANGVDGGEALIVNAAVEIRVARAAP